MRYVKVTAKLTGWQAVEAIIGIAFLGLAVKVAFEGDLHKSALYLIIGWQALHVAWLMSGRKD